MGVRTLYGDIDRVEPEPTRALECPPPPPCPACPPPVDCGVLGKFPVDPETQDPRPTPDFSEPPEGVGLPGLPASVIPLAHRAVQDGIAECLRSASDNGVALLELTVTATEGQGFIRNATVSRATRGAREVSDCLVESARRVRFEWSGRDGQLTFKLPVSVNGN